MSYNHKTKVLMKPLKKNKEKVRRQNTKCNKNCALGFKVIELIIHRYKLYIRIT